MDWSLKKSTNYYDFQKKQSTDIESPEVEYKIITVADWKQHKLYNGYTYQIICNKKYIWTTLRFISTCLSDNGNSIFYTNMRSRFYNSKQNYSYFLTR